MDAQKQLHENISALADGELPASEAELAFAALDTPDGWAAWNAYHQIGHTLRSDQFGAELSEGFAARLAGRLAAERHPSAIDAEMADDSGVPAPVSAASTSLP
jgi:sigma-E factor negative regulatory protein RseA